MYVTFNKPESHRKNIFVKDNVYDNVIQICESIFSYVKTGHLTTTDVFFNISSVLNKEKNKLPLKLEAKVIFEGKGYKYEDIFPINANWDMTIIYINQKTGKAELFTMEIACYKNKRN